MRYFLLQVLVALSPGTSNALVGLIGIWLVS